MQAIILSRVFARQGNVAFAVKVRAGTVLCIRIEKQE